jgi:hypothetical protein
VVIWNSSATASVIGNTVLEQSIRTIRVSACSPEQALMPKATADSMRQVPSLREIDAAVDSAWFGSDRMKTPEMLAIMHFNKTDTLFSE